MDDAWKDIDSCPKDGSIFLALVGGAVYAAKHEDGRFMRLSHTNVGKGDEYRIHEIDGKRLLEKTAEAQEKYEANFVIWQRGFEDKPTLWTTMPPLPNNLERKVK